MSQKFLVCLVTQFAIMCVISIFVDKSLSKSLYWLGACLLNIGVLLMK